MLRITRDQLKAILEYYDMYGVEEMDFHEEHFKETLENFAIRPIKLEPKQCFGRSLDFSRKKHDEKA